MEQKRLLFVTKPKTKEREFMTALKKTMIVIGSILLALVFILLCAIGYFRLPVNEYYKNSQKAFVLPELNGKYVPQGLCYDSADQKFILTGYMKDHSCSPVYVVDKQSGDLEKSVLLKSPDGSDYTGHGGGIAIWKDYLYVADGSENALYVYKYSDLKNAKDGGSIISIGTFGTEKSKTDYVKPSCVEVYGDKIVIGEFFREESYPTPDSHKITTPSGDKNTALALEFSLDENAEFGINPVPEKAYSLREQVQGITFYNGKILLSTSWGLSFSHIFAYDLAKASTSTTTALGQEVGLVYLDSACLQVNMKIAPMSEEMAVVDGKLYVSCESASNKYIFGKLTGGKWCYATDLSKYGL